MKTSTKYTLLTGDNFARIESFFTGSTATEIAGELHNLIYTYVSLSWEHAEPSYLNKALAVAKTFSRYQVTLATLKQVTAFSFDAEAGGFGGKMSSKRKKRLSEGQWIDIFDAVYLSEEASHQEKQAKRREYDSGKTQAAIVNLLVKAIENNDAATLALIGDCALLEDAKVQAESRKQKEQSGNGKAVTVTEAQAA